jgi:response regulator RpfG family c-di-GMP phosphodiesterase
VIEPKAISTAPFTVLLVDDQPIVAEGVRRLLERVPGVRFESCQKAVDAVARAKELMPAVILQDLNLPDGDGLALVEAYRATPGLESTSVLVLSAEENAGTKADAFARGANDYLVKLPPAQEFVARVVHHADAARAQRERDLAYSELARAERELAERNALLDQVNLRLAASNRELKVDVGTQRDRLDRIAHVSADLARVQDLDIMLTRILREAVSLANCVHGAMYIVEADRLRAAEVVGASISTLCELPLGESTAVGAVTMRNTLARLDRIECARSGRDLPAIGTEALFGDRTKSALIVPVARAEGKVMGCIALLDGRATRRDAHGFDEADEQIVTHFASLASVAIERAQLVRAMILRMISMAEMRDPTETAGHVGRVADLSIMIYDEWCDRHPAQAANSARVRDSLRIGALLHDVGKVGISDAILRKPGRLDEAEFAEMKRHTVIGAGFFSGIRTDFDEIAASIALRHHERWDGRGYPEGLKGEDIPLFARIVAVADVYDALSSHRSYKETWSRAKIVEFFEEQSGKHFDSELAQILLLNLPVAEAIRARRPD